MSGTMVPVSRAQRRTPRGERSRQTILETAARLATVEGLEGLSIGRLAAVLGISKSGLYAHFGSKEELQLAAIETAVEIYNREIVEPALAVQPGIKRVLRLCDAFFDFVGSGDFPGGCFFVYTSVDPANRRETIRSRLADEQRAWLGFIEKLVGEAVEAGDLPQAADPTVLAFELDAIMIGADANFVLLGDRTFLDAGRAAIQRRLATPEGVSADRRVP
jgi:AcrR family transcriptional regulator